MQEVFKLAKALHDARMKECYMGDRVQSECDKFPADLKPNQYVTPQPWIDVALAQARAIFKIYNIEPKV